MVALPEEESFWFLPPRKNIDIFGNRAKAAAAIWKNNNGILFCCAYCRFNRVQNCEGPKVGSSPNI